MAVTSKVYGPALISLFNGEIDYDTATVKALLCSSSYVPNQDTHRYKSDVTNEITGTGYTAGGVVLSSKTVTYDAATNTLTLDAADPSWGPTATFTFRYLVFYADTGTAATSPLISYTDFGADVSVTSASFTGVLSSGGIVQATAAA